jgi:hypothetical protein
MKIEKIKEKMIAYRDFYGCDLLGLDRIEQAETKDDLKEIIDEHESFIEDMLSDAKSHLSHFRQSLEF